jgi:glutamine amidotransferase
MSRIAIVDYDMANLRSVQKAFEHVGHAAVVVTQPGQIDVADKVVLPGVGAFGDAIKTLRDRELAPAILRHINRGKPFLGVCLGLQMLFEVGYEDGTHQGLGVLGGAVRRFTVDRTQSLKVPHMGWNQLTIKKPSPLLRGLPDEANVYFVHGYHAEPTDPGIVATTTDYGGPFVSSIWRDNVMATQFHPEKSQSVGLTMLKNFAEL